MEIKKTLTLKDYLAGALLANSLAWLTLGITLQARAEVLLPMYLSGVILAGYLAARKALQNHMKVGLKIGLGSFVFHVYVFMGVIELITGHRFLGMLDHLLILGIFVSGGSIGAFLYKQLSSGVA